jgi:hypothetical protein
MLVANPNPVNTHTFRKSNGNLSKGSDIDLVSRVTLAPHCNPVVNDLPDIIIGYTFRISSWQKNIKHLLPNGFAVFRSLSLR